MNFSTNQDIQAQVETFETVSDIIMADIVREARAKKRGRPTGMASLLDLDLSAEVGRLTPPVRIYRVGPAGELVLKEQVQAITFRRRALESVGGKAFQERIEELQRKRRKAGQRSKAKNRAARLRAGLVPRQPIEEDDDALDS